MRVIGGIAKGRRLQAPRGRHTRPTSDYLREVLFNLLREEVSGKSFLDLYAGTGAVGIEALSRGAASAVFVEHDRSALVTLRRNLEVSGFLDRAEVVPIEVLRYLRRAASDSRHFDLIFLDPPYQQADLQAALFVIGATGLLSPVGMAVLERSVKAEPNRTPPDGLTRLREVRHGDAILEFYRREAA